MTHGLRPAVAPALSAIAAVLLMLPQPASAQQEAAKPDNGLERAQKAADAVFHWIKLNADKGANRQAVQAPAPAPARKPAAAPVAAAPKPAAAPAPAMVATPTPTQQAAASSPAPVMATAMPEPEPERTPVVLASAEPTPAPAPPPPIAVAVQATEPPPPPAEEVQAPLKLLTQVTPTIPRQLEQQGFTKGFVQVRFTVAPDGTVIQAQSIKSSHGRLAAAAIEAVKQWRFAPIAKPREAAVEVAFSSDN